MLGLCLKAHLATFLAISEWFLGEANLVQMNMQHLEILTSILIPFTSGNTRLQIEAGRQILPV